MEGERVWEFCRNGRVESGNGMAPGVGDAAKSQPFDERFELLADPVPELIWEFGPVH